LKSDDKAKIESATETLMTASQKLGEKMYAQAQTESQAGAKANPQAGPSGAGGQQDAHRSEDDNVVDAEFKEVKRG